MSDNYYSLHSVSNLQSPVSSLQSPISSRPFSTAHTQRNDSVLTALSNAFSAILDFANGRLRMVISPLVDALMFAPSEAKSPVRQDWAFCFSCFCL